MSPLATVFRAPVRCVGVLLTVLAVAAALAAAPAHAAPSAAPASTSAPWFGLLAASTPQDDALAGSPLGRVMVPAGWDALEPQRGVFDPWAAADLRARVTAALDRHLAVVLDPGLQYPPAWVFDLPGGTRFVNQYGDVWHGDLGSDVADAVFNQAVRAEEGRYLAGLGAVLQGLPVVAVRVGGLLTAELRYPPATYNGHGDSLWLYGPSAQAAAPVKGWVPGTGTATQVRSSLTYYTGALTTYMVWLLRTVAARFPGVEEQVLFPSWGLRPGMVDAAVADRLNGTSPGERNGDVAAGTDWIRQLRAAAATGLRVVAYTTWLDAPDYGTSAQAMSPARYLAGLAAPYGIPVAGENTGGGGLAALSTALQRVAELHLTGMMFMSGNLIDAGRAGLTVDDLRSAVAAFVAANGS